MAAPVDICNMALAYLGARPIAKLDEVSKTAGLCAIFYESARDDLLQSWEWSWALGRRTLASTGEKPAFGFDYAYSIPTDILRVLQAYVPAPAVLPGDYLTAYPTYLLPAPSLPISNGLQEVTFKLEGEVVLTNAPPPLLVLCICRCEDPTTWSSDFRRALALRIASELAIALTENASLKAALANQSEAVLAGAQLDDSKQRSPPTLPWVTPGSIAAR